jgi:hypothetical protein
VKKQIEALWNLSLSSISADGGFVDGERIFDFFSYSGGGKLICMIFFLVYA